ncbi:hypothetical protein [Actinoallomurus purpureus]|uniref:hypothetical protein n=1 Tax=Actinoallomurus purpureus TaxID=478114 RepID=UPI0035561D47
MLEEWAYAGGFFTYTGAIASHLTTGLRPRRVGTAHRPRRADRTVVGPAPPESPHASPPEP